MESKMLAKRLLLAIILTNFTLVSVVESATPNSNQILRNADKIIQTEARIGWMIEAIQQDNSIYLEILEEYIGSKSYRSLDLVLGKCVQPLFLSMEYECNNIFAALSGVSNASLHNLITWQTAEPNSPHAQYLVASYFHNRAKLHRYSAELFNNVSADSRKYRIFENIALFELDNLLEKNPEYSYAIALKLELLGSAFGPNKKFIEQQINHALKLSNNSWIIPAAILENMTPRAGGSYDKMKRFINLWHKQFPENESSAMLAALVQLERAADSLDGFETPKSSVKAYKYLLPAFETGLRTKDMLLRLGTHSPGHKINNHVSAWKYAAYLSAPYSIDNLITLGSMDSLGETEESDWYFSNLSALNPDHLYPNYKSAKSAIKLKEYLKATRYLNNAQQLSLLTKKLKPLNKSLGITERYENLTISSYLSNSMDYELLYFKYAADYLLKSKFASADGVTISGLLKVFPPNQLQQALADNINISSLTEDQLILLSDIENSNRDVIAHQIKSGSKLTPDLEIKLIEASNRLKSSMVASMQQEFDRYLVEMDGRCFIDCKWKTSK